MALHFERAEFAARRDRTLAAMAEAGLDGLLMFKQESMFWLTGYDTFGFCFFQCLYLDADGSFVLLTRAPDLRQARNTSLIEDIRIWVDRDGATPADDLRDLLAEKGAKGRRLGVEYDSYGLNARNGKRLDAALDGFAALADASELVSRLRMVKSPAELAYVRRAAELADDALEEAHRLTGPGADEGDILAAMQGAVFKGGGDYPGNEFIIGSGPDALLCRYFTGRRRLGSTDQLTLEFAGAYRHYHACLMRTIPVGPVPDHQRRMFDACAAALEACKGALRPGRPIGEVFDAHARVMDGHGFRHARLNACGYSLGAVFAPIWMDYPMFYHANPEPAAPGMVFFLHMILMDSEADLAMTLGETVIVTDGEPERLSRMPLELVCR
ncbi:Xaa-Pro dipeptidase [Thalassobaculum fulvum]|uniref:Xaa-Pro dipeptidase n=1 Tax=Thalassobaculum fulvum TaxID=1633335 RepID=A0A918XT36_9PROT|nr:Xaa-Pro peptidase family protein [Thalassobaculum fulvum]GHD53988.1 Xaa-Pro dipeptidase [Thalassobaculum fulvum]